MPKPYPDFIKTKLAKKYHFKGYTYRKIAELLGVNAKQAWLWVHYDLRKYRYKVINR